jgi:ubiquinone/menaquinone biosynthesis C-methylase UbiE
MQMKPENNDSEQGIYKRYIRMEADGEFLDNAIVASLEEKYQEKQKGLNSVRTELKNYFRDLELRGDLLQDKKVLDIGAADHFFDEYCKKKYNCDVVAVDISEDSLDKNHPLGVVADARSLPFGDESFDIVISHASMPHILVPIKDKKRLVVKFEGELKVKVMNDVLSVFRESYRTLKPGGQIRMSTFTTKSEWLHIADRISSGIRPFITKNSHNQFSRITLVKDALEVFENETGAMCTFKAEGGNGLIIIKKPKVIT